MNLPLDSLPPFRIPYSPGQVVGLSIMKQVCGSWLGKVPCVRLYGYVYTIDEPLCLKESFSPDKEKNHNCGIQKYYLY